MDQDLELWKQWKKTKTTYDLERLMQQVKPLLDREISKWSAIGSRLLLENTAKRLALKAFEEYDPNRGVKLSTYLINALQKLSRTAYERQNSVSVPEYQRLTFNKFLHVKTQLADELGQEPTIQHIADHLAIPVPRLKAIIANVGKKELMESGEGPVFQVEHDNTNIIELAYQQLTPIQKQIFDLRTGKHGAAEAKSDAEIKLKLNITQSVLSYQLRKIQDTFKEAKRFMK
jgi:DNA-directed RNA polymerase specialized sigma subunit